MDFADPELKAPPAHDDLEVAVFGPGVGECVVVHLGDGRWMVVDSCLVEGEPVAVRYLEALGVPLTSVVAQIATHWHDDHHRGIARAFNRFPNATFYCSGALDTKEFITLAATARGHFDSESGIDEFHSVLLELHRRLGGRPGVIGPEYLAAGTRFLQTTSEPKTEVWALSPSSAAKTKAVQVIADLIPRFKAPKRRIVSTSPNHASVALQVFRGATSILLGSDLEEEGEGNTGWSAVIANQVNVGGPSAVYKVAHHGSANGHHDGIFTDLLAPSPLGLLTPYRRSKLPTAADVVRLKARCSSVHLTAPTEGRKTTPRPRVVEKIIRDTVTEHRAEVVPMGMVRIRWGASPTPVVQHFGTAAAV